MSKEKQIKVFDIRKAFEKGKNNTNPIVRVTTKIGEYIWDTGIILGNALTNVPEKRKDK